MTATLALRAAVIGLSVMAAGCTTTGVLNALSSSDEVHVTRDLAYGADPRQRLDVFSPVNAAPKRPVVVFFYGGSWDSGAKGDYRWLGTSLARQGYVAVVPDYRLYPQVVWPAFLQDGAAATRWARDHAEAYGGDPSRLVLMGHSAGAYIALDLALDKRWLRGAGVDPATDIKAVVGLSGPYDFLPLQSERLKEIFGPSDRLADTQPINHVDGPGAPMLLITGDRDAVVDPGNSDRLAKMVRAAGGDARVIHFPKLNHATTAGALAPPLHWLAPVMADVADFIDHVTAASPPEANTRISAERDHQAEP